MSVSSKNNVRRAAVSALRAWSKGHDYADTLIERHASRNNLSAPDRNLLNSILMAVIRHKNVLDFWIKDLRKGRLDDEVRDILRTGLAQLLILGIPDHAAVNETVNCGKASVRGLLNAVMRSAITKRKKLFEKLEDEDDLSIVYSTPEWIISHWIKKFGKANTEALLAWNNEPAETYCRLNSLKPELHEQILADETLEPHEKSKGYFTIKGRPNNQWLASGSIYIQDPSTRHSVELLNPQAGESVLDACAAPGGKASLIGSKMNNEGTLICTDSNEKRLKRLSENLSNQGVSIAEVSVWDWTEPAPERLHNSFDAILLDVPCSNTGVFRRRVDARWRMRPDSVAKLRETQLAILENALACLKPNGRMVYSTCSIESEENQGVVEAFLDKHPEYKVSDSRTITPWKHDSDGAYAALIELK